MRPNPSFYFTFQSSKIPIVRQYAGEKGGFTPRNWLLQRLEHARRAYMAAGELRVSIEGHHEGVAEAIKTSLRTGCFFELVCGPEIFVDSSTRRNEIFFLIDDEEEAVKNNFRVYVPAKRIPFHFMIIDNDIIVENSHFRSSRSAPFFAVDNSKIWRDHLLLYFNQLKRGSQLISSTKEYDKKYLCTLSDLEKLDEDEFGEEFTKIMNQNTNA
jgi:hypothetical protein